MHLTLLPCVVHVSIDLNTLLMSDVRYEAPYYAVFSGLLLLSLSLRPDIPLSILSYQMPSKLGLKTYCTKETLVICL